jgi:hypothetical protein
MASPGTPILTPPENVFALMGVQIRVVIDTVLYANCAGNWRDTLSFDPLKGNLHTSIGNSERRSIRRGSVAQQSPRHSG